MTTQPEALRLADLLCKDGHECCDFQAAAELRRLHAQRDALLEALAWIDRRCPAFFLLQDLHKVHMEAAFDAGVCARAAIKQAEENT